MYQSLWIRQMALSQSEAASARMLCRVDLQPHGVWLTSSNDPCLKQGELFLCVNKHAKTIIAQQLSYLKIKLYAQLYLDIFANWNWSLNIGTEI